MWNFIRLKIYKNGKWVGNYHIFGINDLAKGRKAD